MMAGFGDVNREIGALKDNLSELASGSKGIAALARQFAKLKMPTEAIDQIRELSRATEGLATNQAKLAQDAAETAKAWRQMAEASKGMRLPGAPPVRPGATPRSGHGHTSMLDAAMGAQMAGDAGMGLLERGFRDYADVQLQGAMAQSDKRVTDAVMQRANALIATLQKQYPALTQAEGLTLFRNTMGVFGNADELLEALPGAARLQQLYQLAPIGKGGSGGSEVQAAEKAGDALQAFINPKTQKLDKDLYSQWMDFQARSYQAGGGLIDAKSWLAFARTSRSAGISLSPHALEEAQALLEMSPGRTGTAMMSAFQVFGASTKHMTKKNRSAWSDAGLLNKKSGDIVDRELYQKDPFEWVWKDMLPRLAKKGVTTRDQILRWLTDNGQRSTVSGYLADIAIGRTPISNTATKMEVQDPNLVDKLTQTDTGKLAAFHAAETNFFVALGKFEEGPGIALLTKLTDALNGIVKVATDHPDAAANIVLYGGGMALLAKVFGDTAMATIFVGGPLLNGFKGLARVLVPFASDGLAGAALATLGGAGAGSLVALGVGIIGLAAATTYASQHLPSVYPNVAPGKPEGGITTGLKSGLFGVAGGMAGMALQYFGLDPSAKPSAVTVQTTNHIYIDGKKVQTTASTSLGVQSGTTGHDGRMGLYPAGPSAGSGQ